MNSRQFLHLLIGLLLILVGAYLAYLWDEEVLIFIKGAIPFVFFAIGILWALIGYLIAEDVE